MSTRRIHLDISDAVSVRLDALRVRVGAADNAALIARALAVYEALWAAKDRGEQAVIVSGPEWGEKRREIDLR